jgi:hypothetical protein
MRKKPGGKKTTTKRPPKSADGYEVGYGKPPKSKQWKPGQSGNPKGRGKKAKSVNARLDAALKAKVKVRVGTKVRTMATIDAIIWKLREMALKGNLKAVEFFMRYYDEQQVVRESETRTLKKLDYDKMSAADVMKVYQSVMKGGVRG